MLYPVSLTQKWQMTLPKDVRRLFDIDKPGKVLIEVSEKKNTITIKKTPSIFDLAGTFVPRRKINAVKTRSVFESAYERT